MKGRKVCFWFLLIVLAIFFVSCGESDSTEKKEAALKSVAEWFAFIDKGEYGKSWDEASKDLQENFPRYQWVDYLNSKQKIYGKSTKRNLQKFNYHTSLLGSWNKEYFVFEYESSFTKQNKIIEAVTVTKEITDEWFVSGYKVKEKNK